MKGKEAIKFSVRIFFILICCLLISCSVNQNKQIQFNAERYLHRAEKIYNTAAIKPDLTDILTWSSVKSAYLKTINYCYTHLDSISVKDYREEREGLESIAFMATSRLSSIYYAEAKFDSSIIILEQLLSLTNPTDRALLSAESNLARAYHAKGDWQSGIDIYKSLIDTFYPPVDKDNKIIHEVLNLPIELFNINLKLKNITDPEKGSQSAREYYRRLIAEWPDTELQKAARRALARLYTDLSRWNDAIETLSLVRDSTGQVGVPETMKIGELYTTGKKDYTAAIGIYNQLLNRVDDSTLLATIYTRIGIAYFDNKSYSECRATMETIKENFYSLYMSDPIPQKYIAMSYEKQGDWDRAESEYQWLITNFPDTEAAFNAFLVVADHYASLKNERLADAWYQKADEFYTRMQFKHAGTYIEASAISYRAEVARRQKKWEVAARRLEELFSRFPDKEIGYKGLINAIAIYRDKLNNKAKADSLQALIKPGT